MDKSRKSMALDRVADTQSLLLHDADVGASGTVISFKVYSLEPHHLAKGTCWQSTLSSDVSDALPTALKEPKD